MQKSRDKNWQEPWQDFGIPVYVFETGIVSTSQIRWTFWLKMHFDVGKFDWDFTFVREQLNLVINSELSVVFVPDQMVLFWAELTFVRVFIFVPSSFFQFFKVFLWTVALNTVSSGGRIRSWCHYRYSFDLCLLKHRHALFSYIHLSSFKKRKTMSIVCNARLDARDI